MKKNYPDNLPPRFAENVVGICGEAGKVWLKDLPLIIDELSEKWSLRAQNPFPNLSYNYVAPCVGSKGIETVLKIALPLNQPEIFNEAAFLRSAGGKGAVKLLASDEHRRAVLLEKLTPGANLKQVCRGDELKAAEIAVGLMRELIKPPPPDFGFKLLAEWFGDFFEKARTTNFPPRTVSRTREFFERLSSISERKFLIHGDLHHENILSATREPFLAVDPKGIVGDIGYEAAVFLNNHLRWLASAPDLREKLGAAISRFSEAFEIETKDLRKWAFAQIALSAWWTFEENGESCARELALAEFWEV